MKPHLELEEVKLAKLVRSLIDSLCQRRICENLISQLQIIVTRDVVPLDSSLGNRILNKLSRDSSFVKDCLYVADLKRNWKAVAGKHFIFYFKNSDVPDTSKMREWDEHFEKLANTFDIDFSEKVPYKIDPSEKYGRSFAPWEVQWGIRWRRLADSFHELVHIMLFKYSDVPFFHEPLAFIYGTYKGDFRVVNEHWSEYEKTISDSGYVSATELFHFPQLVGLYKSKRASAFYFVYQLLIKHGIEKLLTFMERTPWESSETDFAQNFQKIYGLALKRIEEDILTKFRRK